MRLHHLKIEAFGPYGGTVEIDFDELNSAGQFLISGATGSGKTFILDAVCFALYGEVPGERQRARHLRSDHASATAEPRVTLTLTVAERLIRISRSPAWNRPKRRGEGTTLQQASVRLEQRVDDEWLVLATRLDEAGHLISTWLGMTATQFTQVALLPQGGFQTFLHAPTAARQAILQRLFRTDRFERVEKWFGDLRRSLNRSRHEALHLIDIIAHRLGEASQAPAPPTENQGVEVLMAWAEEQRSAVDAERAAAAGNYAEAQGAYAEAAHQLAQAVEAVALWDRAADARQQLKQLDESAAAFADELMILRAHERAKNLVPLVNAHRVAESAAREAERSASGSLEQAGLASADSARLTELVADAKQSVLQAEHALLLATKAEEANRHREEADELWTSAVAELTTLRKLTAALPQDLEQIAQRVQEAATAEVERVSVCAELDLVQRQRAAAIELVSVRAELSQLLTARSHQQTRVQDLREVYQNAREARIEAMASELAGALVVGCSCPVCGSTSHPAPATGIGHGGRKAEERARRAYESATVELTALDEVIAGLRGRITALAHDVEEASVEELTAQSEELRERYEALGGISGTIEQLRRAEEGIKQQLAAARTGIEQAVLGEAQARARLESLAETARALHDELLKTLGEYPDAATFAAQARARETHLLHTLATVRAFEDAKDIAMRHQQTLDAEATALGFTSGDHAASSLIDDDAAADLARQERERETARLAAAELLKDPAVVALAHTPRPDIEALHTRTALADQQRSAAHANLQIAETRRQRSHAIAEELHAAIRRYRPLETKAAQVTALSGLLEGTSVDNQLRMRLSAFVLAERLRQVIAAANARLETISEGRYVLHYQEERGAGDNRGGLSLSILDEWTGIRRDPTTLSGGETFVVSLCLALGLADTVADESGGLRIDTLFIDEGFGSLDAQTLDSVIDILGQLSQGGRVTGVVSHVQELRERLPAVLEVVPSKSGSTVRRATA